MATGQYTGGPLIQLLELPCLSPTSFPHADDVSVLISIAGVSMLYHMHRIVSMYNTETQWRRQGVRVGGAKDRGSGEVLQKLKRFCKLMH